MIWQAVDGFLSKRPMILFQNYGWLYVQKSRWLFAKTADGSLPKPLMALCQNRWWLSAKTADGSGGGL
jgi:cytolysin (calcineurin-like family phosphatase)